MPPISSISRYWHTLRYLRPIQFYGRAWFRLVRPRPDLAPAPLQRAAAAGWVHCARRSSMLGPDRFQFLSVERRIVSAEDWNCEEWPKLWLYNAHYFDDLVADAAEDRVDWHRTLIARWISENPPGTGNGWEPYPSSLRVVNWVKWALSGNQLDEGAVHSLAVQVRYLRRRLEIHLLGNHLWANAKALIFAGAFFEGDEANSWLKKGLQLLRRELREQILPDGGHFERSPMYHSILLEDVLDLLQLASVFQNVFRVEDISQWRDVAERMQRWLQAMSHPDGHISFFNDAALEIATSPHELYRYAERLGVLNIGDDVACSVALKSSGYVRLENEPAVLIADVGDIGPDYLPGHAHADTLSLEFSLFGSRVFVNSGISGYEAGSERVRQRGTDAHNTVSINGANSSEVWSSFRVARRARVSGVAYDLNSGIVQAEHDGYRRFPGRPVHRRKVKLDAISLQVNDEIRGGGRHLVQANWHLHPDLQIESVDDNNDQFVLHVPVEGQLRQVKLCLKGPVRGIVENSTWHPKFGASVPNKRLLVQYEGSLPISFSTHLQF